MAIVVPPFRIVNVTVPPLTAPAPLVIVAVRGTDWATVLKVVEALLAAVVVPAALTVREWLVSM